MNQDKRRKALFLTFCLISLVCLVGFDTASGSEGLTVSVDRSTMLKIIGCGIVAMLAEIWRNQRALFRITNQHGEELKKLAGFCEGKNKNCGK